MSLGVAKDYFGIKPPNPVYFLIDVAADTGGLLDLEDESVRQRFIEDAAYCDSPVKEETGIS